jgi:hypothetical protein
VTGIAGPRLHDPRGHEVVHAIGVCGEHRHGLRRSSLPEVDEALTWLGAMLLTP